MICGRAGALSRALLPGSQPQAQRGVLVAATGATRASVAAWRGRRESARGRGRARTWARSALSWEKIMPAFVGIVQSRALRGLAVCYSCNAPFQKDLVPLGRSHNFRPRIPSPEERHMQAHTASTQAAPVPPPPGVRPYVVCLRSACTRSWERGGDSLH